MKPAAGSRRFNFVSHLCRKTSLVQNLSREIGMFKLGLCSVTFREKSTDEIIRIVVDQGLEGIEWGGDVHARPGALGAGIKELGEMCHEAGLHAPSYGSYFDALENEPHDFTAVLETAGLLGVDTIRIWPGWVDPGQETPEQRARIVSTSRNAAEQAAVRNIRVAFEFHDHTLTEGADNTLRLLEEIGYSNVYTYYQLIRPDDFAWNLENFDKVYPRLAYVHVQANDGERNLPLEDYRDLWREIIRRLKDRGYNGWLFFEFNQDNSVAQLEKDVALIRSFMK